MVQKSSATGSTDLANDWSLANLLRGHAKIRGDSPMLTYGDLVMSYAEMDERSSRLAQGLLAEGVRPGDHVAFLEKNCPEYFEVLFGCAKIGAINVAVNWRLSPREVAFIVNDAQAKVLFVGTEFVSLVDEIEPSLETVSKIVVIGNHARHEGYDAWLNRQDAVDPRMASDLDDVAMQLYTSGTTGLPKGAMLTNRNLAGLMAQVSDIIEIGPDSVSLVAMPLFHIAGSGWALIGMQNGCSSILIRDIIPQPLLASFETHRITHALLVPALLQMLPVVPGAQDVDYSALKLMCYGASPITTDALVRAMQTFKCGFVQVYGLTETTGAITQLEARDHDPSGPNAHLLRSAGKPYPWVEMRVVDPATEQIQPAGSVGEIWTRSVQNMKGYWNRPEDTAQAITPDGWFRTGDAGYIDEDGYVFLTDRIKDMIVSGGENVYPIEVENVLADHPDVVDVAVIGIPDDTWGEAVAAIVVARPESELGPESVISFARERLAHFKCPRFVQFAETLPRNPSGKLLKRELREPFWAGKERRVN